MAVRNEYRVALIGCGDIAETGHVPALIQHPRFKLQAVCDVRAQRRELLALQAGGVRAVAHYRELLADKDIDAVILALHPEVSVDVAIDALHAGKAVLDEKPLARSIESGLRLAHEVAETRGVYQIGFVFRYCQLFERLAAHANRIGAPALFSVNIYDEKFDPGNSEHFERINRILKNSSAITHEGSHVIDYFQVLRASPLTHAQAESVRTDESFAGSNLWNAQFRCADGSALALQIGWFVPEVPPSEIRIVGPHGHLRADLRTGRGSAHYKSGVEELELQPMLQDWQRQLDHFATAIDSGKASHATIEDGLRVLRATIACEESARTQQVIRLV